jgi:hypothetical protein
MRFLRADQTQQRVNISEELRQIASDDTAFLSRVIASDESWIYSYDPETKQLSFHWRMRSRVNMLILFYILFYIRGIVHKEFLLSGRTVNSAYYCDT